MTRESVFNKTPARVGISSISLILFTITTIGGMFLTIHRVMNLVYLRNIPDSTTDFSKQLTPWMRGELSTVRIESATDYESIRDVRLPLLSCLTLP